MQRWPKYRCSSCWEASFVRGGAGIDEFVVEGSSFAMDMTMSESEGGV